ncbi:hypothetical protein QZH41_013679, partial [Actinostola sp. cb2023]
MWRSLPSSLQVNIEETKFASGGFRDAYLAKCVDSSSALRGDWVVKSCPKHNSARFTTKVPVEFGDAFKNGKVFFSIWNDLAVKVEDYVPCRRLYE